MPKNLGCIVGSGNCLGVFHNFFSPFQSLFKLPKISIKFMFTPALTFLFRAKNEGLDPVLRGFSAVRVVKNVWCLSSLIIDRRAFESILLYTIVSHAHVLRLVTRGEERVTTFCVGGYRSFSRDVITFYNLKLNIHQSFYPHQV